MAGLEDELRMLLRERAAPPSSSPPDRLERARSLGRARLLRRRAVVAGGFAAALLLIGGPLVDRIRHAAPIVTTTAPPAVDQAVGTPAVVDLPTGFWFPAYIPAGYQVTGTSLYLTMVANENRWIELTQTVGGGTPETARIPCGGAARPDGPDINGRPSMLVCVGFQTRLSWSVDRRWFLLTAQQTAIDELVKVARGLRPPAGR